MHSRSRPTNLVSVAPRAVKQRSNLNTPGTCVEKTAGRREMTAKHELLNDGGPVSSGLPALDYILSGGFAARRVHLLEGEPGAGKTTLGLQFLLEGRAKGERCL